MKKTLSVIVLGLAIQHGAVAQTVNNAANPVSSPSVAGGNSTASAPPATYDESAIKSTASNWLDLVDKGSYQDSWQNGASVLRKTVDSSKWTATLAGIRNISGALVQRKLVGGSFSKDLYSNSETQMIILHYQSTFENRPDAKETLVLTPDANGQWHVSGYLLK